MVKNSTDLVFTSSSISTDAKGLQQTIIRAGTNAALQNSGVMRHGLNTIYYANQNRPIMAAREGAAAVWDAVTGSRK